MRSLALALLLAGALSGCLAGDQPLARLSIDDYAAERDDMLEDGLLGIPQAFANDTLAGLYHFSQTFAERADNYPDHRDARDWMADEFASYGLDVWRQEFTNGIVQENIAGIKWGQVRDQWVVVGAHYDMTVTDCAAGSAAGIDGERLNTCASRPYSQGAYDDGSGTLMTINLAKAFADADPYYTMVFVAFDGEERGLQGSGAFALAVEEQNIPFMDGPVTLRGMLDLDMIGLNWPGVDVPIYYDHNSDALADRIVATADAMGMPDEAIHNSGLTLGRSDYAHFFRMGVPTMFLISDFETWQAPADLPATIPAGAYPFWHVQDTYDTMEMMAGSAEDLEAGFQTALDLSTDLLVLMAMEPEVELDAVER